jgi:hypothetical protein
MRPGRRAVRGVIAASVVAAAVGHAAATRATDERGVREHRFTLVLRGSMVTTWTLPHAPFQDSTITDPRSGETCVRWWVGGEGRQEVTFGVRAPVRMGSGSTLPTPTGFKKIPWRAERHGTMLIETQPLRSCGGEYRQPIGGAEGDCGTREILGYIGVRVGQDRRRVLGQRLQLPLQGLSAPAGPRAQSSDWSARLVRGRARSSRLRFVQRGRIARDAWQAAVAIGVPRLRQEAPARALRGIGDSTRNRRCSIGRQDSRGRPRALDVDDGRERRRHLHTRRSVPS